MRETVVRLDRQQTVETLKGFVIRDLFEPTSGAHRELLVSLRVRRQTAKHAGRLQLIQGLEPFQTGDHGNNYPGDGAARLQLACFAHELVTLRNRQHVRRERPPRTRCQTPSGTLV